MMKKYEWRTVFEDLIRSEERPEWLDASTLAVVFALQTWGGWYEPRAVWPSLETIAKRAGVSPTTAQRKVALLRKQGFLRLIKKGGYNSKTGEVWTSQYELTAPRALKNRPQYKKFDLLEMTGPERWAWADKNVPPEEKDETLAWLNRQIMKAEAERDADS